MVSKICTKCGVAKDLSEFHTKGSRNVPFSYILRVIQLTMDWKKAFEETPIKKKDLKKEVEEVKSHRRNTECLVRSDKHLFRRAYSESKLLDAVGIDFKDGESYHCITGGDVDSLSYLKSVLRQQNLNYCLFSTWCMAAEDILCFAEFLEK